MKKYLAAVLLAALCAVPLACSSSGDNGPATPPPNSGFDNSSPAAKGAPAASGAPPGVPRPGGGKGLKAPAPPPALTTSRPHTVPGPP
ncbi:MAG: hypothetical protein KGJ62_08465 [Armatimonadetes bacterium]|nr:hypothetical protein [Armatimonadota bacterium]MDE2205075.1 hypothetical protein [Armatimonadota bacterium]